MPGIQTQRDSRFLESARKPLAAVCTGAPPIGRKALRRTAETCRPSQAGARAAFGPAQLQQRAAQATRSLPNFEGNKQQQTGECQVRVETARSGSDQTGSGALLVGGLAAILASTCCLGPLVLVALGLSGAWIGNLTLLEPYRPFFIAGALVALFFAGRRIFQPAEACQPGEVCAVPQIRRIYKIVFGIVSALVLVAIVFPYVVKLFY